jgi:hypothetical protein
LSFANGLSSGEVGTLLSYLTERWRKHALEEDEITTLNYYEVTAFETLKECSRNGTTEANIIQWYLSNVARY